MRTNLLVSLILLSFSALSPAAATTTLDRSVSATGIIQAVHSIDVRVPLPEGQGGNLTLTRLIQNGAAVHGGDVLAEFDDTAELKVGREAQAKYDDLSHQVDQKRAEHNSNAEKRRADLQQAHADFEKGRF